LALGVQRTVQERTLVRQLEQEIATLQPRVSQVQAVKAQGDAVEKQVRFLEGLMCQRDMNLEVLQELTTVLPPDTFLNFYTNREGTIQISGSSGSAPDLIPKLEKSALLQNVIQRGTVFKDAQTGKDRFNFEARLERVPCNSMPAKSGS
jgi:general secretion pathway protein L